MANVKPIPEGYHTITPYLVVKGAAQAIDFYKKAFGAKEIFRMDSGGKVMHAELQLGDSRFMLGDEHPEMGYVAPQPGAKVPLGLYIYVDDVDKLAAQAQAAGIKVERPVADQFYGDRTGSFIDPFGYRWSIATHKEDVSAEEMEQRMAEAMKKPA
jgi:PhnB protein